MLRHGFWGWTPLYDIYPSRGCFVVGDFVVHCTSPGRSKGDSSTSCAGNRDISGGDGRTAKQHLTPANIDRRSSIRCRVRPPLESVTVRRSRIHRPPLGCRLIERHHSARHEYTAAQPKRQATTGVQKVLQLDHKEERKCYKLHFIFQYNPY